MEVNGGDVRLQIDGDMDLNEHIMHDTGAKAVVIEPDGTYSTMVWNAPRPMKLADDMMALTKLQI